MRVLRAVSFDARHFDSRREVHSRTSGIDEIEMLTEQFSIMRVAGLSALELRLERGAQKVGACVIL